MSLLLNRSFHGFSTFYKEQSAKNPSTQQKSKFAKSQSDLLKTNEDGALQSRWILQTFVLWGGGGGEKELAPHHTNVSTFWINVFALFGRVTFKLGKLLMNIRLLLFQKKYKVKWNRKV